jgi:hypothetical protein
MYCESLDDATIELIRLSFVGHGYNGSTMLEIGQDWVTLVMRRTYLFYILTLPLLQLGTANCYFFWHTAHPMVDSSSSLAHNFGHYRIFYTHETLNYSKINHSFILITTRLNKNIIDC